MTTAEEVAPILLGTGVMSDEQSKAGEVWAVMHRAAQQLIDELRGRGRELDPARIAARVASLLDDVPGVRERVPLLVDELRHRLRRSR